MNHWNLFKEAWRIFWRNQTLWVFGLLAALGGGVNLRYSFNFNYNMNTNFDPELFLRDFNQGWRQMPRLPFEFRALLNQIFSNQTLATIMVIGIVWTIIAFLLATYADGALISMVNAISGGQKVSVGDGFRAGAKRFLHLLAVRLTLALPALILAIIAASVASQWVFGPGDDLNSQQFLTRTFGAVAGLGTLGFVVAVLMMGIGVSAERAVVIDELPIWSSIVKGWKFLWSKFGDYFIIVVLFIGVAILAGLVLACILTPIICGTVGLGAMSAFGDNNWNIFTRVIVFTGPTILVSVLLGLLIGTLVNVFSSSVWTLAYREWNRPAQPAESALQPVTPLGEPPASLGHSTTESTPKDKE
jgi:hypothetical protein